MEIEVTCRPARERCHAEALIGVDPAPSVLPLQTVPVQRGASWTVERHTTMDGRVVADTLPVSCRIVCSVASEGYAPNYVPWHPRDFVYSTAPSARWVMSSELMVLNAMQVDLVTPVVGSVVADCRYDVSALLSDDTADLPMFSYRSGSKWIDCAAAAIRVSGSIAFPVHGEKPFAVLVLGTFSRSGGEASSIIRLEDVEEPAMVVAADVDDTVQFTGGLLSEEAASQSLLGTSDLTAVLAWYDGERCGLWMAAYGKAPTGVQVASSGLVSAASECVIGGYGRGCVVVEMATWSGAFDHNALKQQVAALLSYYHSRRR